MFRVTLCSLILLFAAIALHLPSEALASATPQEKSKSKTQEKTQEKSLADPEAKQQNSDNKNEETEWMEFKVPDSQAILSFPGEPIRRVNLVKSTPESEVTQVVGYRKLVNKGNVLFSFNESILPKDMSQTKDKLTALEWAERNTLAAVLAKKSQKSKRIRYASHPGREYIFEFTFTNPQTLETRKWTSLTRNFIVGQTFYELSSIQRSDQFDESLARKFLSSFQLKDEKK